MSLFGVITITAPYLPLCLVAFSWLLQGGFQAALGDIVSGLQSGQSGPDPPQRPISDESVFAYTLPLVRPAASLGLGEASKQRDLSAKTVETVERSRNPSTRRNVLTPPSGRDPRGTHVRLPAGLLAKRDVEHDGQARSADPRGGVSAVHSDLA